MMRLKMQKEKKTMIFDFDDDLDIADEVIRNIEREYGRTIARIPYFEENRPYQYDFKIIFSDFKLLEGKMQISINHYDMPTVRVSGTYY